MKYKAILLITITACFSAMLTIFPSGSTTGVINGIKLCYTTIIPSLFTFTVCSIIIFKLQSKCSTNRKLKTVKLDSEIFTIFLLSCIGGYPVGAKLVEEKYLTGEIANNHAEKLLYFCVNSAPSFTIIAIGATLLKSATIGFLLYASNIISSIIFLLVFSRKITTNPVAYKKKNSHFRFSDIFVESTYEATKTVVGICSYIVLFYSIIGLLNSVNEQSKLIHAVSSVLEVTYGIFNNTNNIYVISFLLGFGGVCVHFQVMSICKAIKPKYLKFLLVRVLHGLISAIVLFIITKIFRISLPTISQDYSTTILISENSYLFAVILVVISVFFMLSVEKMKKESSNLR